LQHYGFDGEHRLVSRAKPPRAKASQS